jgi:uncharacterized protein (DUF779 family)
MQLLVELKREEIFVMSKLLHNVVVVIEQISAAKREIDHHQQGGLSDGVSGIRIAQDNVQTGVERNHSSAEL